MRSSFSVGLVTVCLGLAGCGAFDKNRNAKGDNGSPKPFTGLAKGKDSSPAAAGAQANNANNGDLPPRIDGFLAGQVMNKANNHRLPSAYIQVVDLQNPRGNEAALNVETDPQGFFTIRGLQKGKQYQLIARAREDGKILAGAMPATPPDPKVCIMVSEDTKLPNAPPLPPEAADGRPGGPAASLDAPIGLPKDPPAGFAGNAGNRSAEIGTPSPGQSAPSRPDPWGDPARTADAGRDGFQKVLPPSAVGSIGGPDTLPPPPSAPGGGPPSVTAIAEDRGTPSGNRWNQGPTEVPSCVLVGRRLDNLALYGLDGQPWEYKRNHKGKLVLLDFWATTCAPCLRAVPELCKLNDRYRPYGLEVIGIAYEEGHFNQQAERVRACRGRLVMNYTTLIGGGGQGPCPVKAQFQVTAFPTLVLLDEYGTVIWRCSGLTSEKKLELEQEICRRLGISMPRWQ